MSDRNAKQIIDEATDLLRTAQFGLEDMARPGRARTGLRNVVVFGRMVTFALQNLRSACPDFDEWYAEKVTEMKADPLMRYLHELRTTIEKKASTPVQTSAYIRSFSSGDISRFQPAPPGAKDFFIGDRAGGSGWMVQTEHGEEPYYVELPPDIGEVHLHLEGAPTEYEGRPAAELLSTYLEKLNALVREAHHKFVG